MAGTIVYKGYTLNTPGTAAPWGQTEFDLFKDIIDTIELLAVIDPGEICYGSSSRGIAHSVGLTYNVTGNLVKIENPSSDHLGAILELSKNPSGGVVDNDVVSRIRSKAFFGSEFSTLFEIVTTVDVIEESISSVTNFFSDTVSVLEIAENHFHVNPNQGNVNFLVGSYSIKNSLFSDGYYGGLGIGMSDSGISNFHAFWPLWDNVLAMNSSSLTVLLGIAGLYTYLTNNLYFNSSSAFCPIRNGDSSLLSISTALSFEAAFDGTAGVAASRKLIFSADRDHAIFNDNDLDRDYSFQVFFRKTNAEYSKNNFKMQFVRALSSVSDVIGGIQLTFNAGDGLGDITAVIPLHEIPS